MHISDLYTIRWLKPGTKIIISHSYFTLPEYEIIFYRKPDQIFEFYLRNNLDDASIADARIVPEDYALAEKICIEGTLNAIRNDPLIEYYFLIGIELEYVKLIASHDDKLRFDLSHFAQYSPLCDLYQFSWLRKSNGEKIDQSFFQSDTNQILIKKTQARHVDFSIDTLLPNGSFFETPIIPENYKEALQTLLIGMEDAINTNILLKFYFEAAVQMGHIELVVLRDNTCSFDFSNITHSSSLAALYNFNWLDPITLTPLSRSYFGFPDNEIVVSKKFGQKFEFYLITWLADGDIFETPIIPEDYKQAVGTFLHHALYKIEQSPELRSKFHISLRMNNTKLIISRDNTISFDPAIVNHALSLPTSPFEYTLNQNNL